MPTSTASLLNCKLVEYLDAAAEDLVGGESYIEIWNQFLEVLSEYRVDGEFAQAALQFLGEAHSIPHELIEGESSEALFRVLHHIRLSKRAGGTNAIPTICDGTDPIKEVLYWYYMAQISYLLGSHDTVLDCAETCIQWSDRADDYCDSDKLSRALYWYRYLLMTLLLDISYDRGSRLNRDAVRRLRKQLGIKMDRYSNVMTALYEELFSEPNDQMHVNLQDYLRFSLSVYPLDAQHVPEVGDSSFERCYTASSSLRVAVKQFHDGHPLPALKTLNRVCEIAGDEPLLQPYAMRALFYRGLIRKRTNDLADAWTDLLKAESYFASIGDVFAHTRCRISIAEVRIRRFDLRQAGQELKELIEVCRRNNYRGELGIAHWLRGKVYSLMHRQWSALTEFGESLATYRDSHILPHVLDMLYWKGVACCRWQRAASRPTMVSTGIGYLAARSEGRKRLPRQLLHQTLLERPTRLEDEKYTNLLIALALGDVSGAIKLAEQISQKWVDPNRSQTDRMQAVRERRTVALLNLQIDGIIGDVETHSLKTSITGKERVRQDLAKMLGLCAGMNLANVDHKSLDELYRVAQSFNKHAESTGLRKGLVNLLDEFSYSFLSRSLYLAIVVILLHGLQQVLRARVAKRVPQEDVEWLNELLRHGAEFLNREKLTRLETVQFGNLSIHTETLPLATRLSEMADIETFATHYRAYTTEMAGMRFGEPRLGRVEQLDPAEITLFVPNADGAVSARRISSVSQDLLDRYECATKNRGIVIQLWTYPDSNKRWILFPISDVSEKDLASNEVFEEFYRRLIYGTSESPCHIDEDIVDRVRTEVLTEYSLLPDDESVDTKLDVSEDDSGETSMSMVEMKLAHEPRIPRAREQDEVELFEHILDSLPM